MRFIADILGRAEGFLRKRKNYLLRKSDTLFREVEKWHKDDPHNLKRSDFVFLNQDSVVFDLGGYEGQWTSDIYSRYRCRKMFVFEPVSEYASIIKDRFQKNPDISVFAAGLAAKDGKATITVNEFSSTISNNDSKLPSEEIQLFSFEKFCAENNIDSIDLIKINIEGAEYELLDHIISRGLQKKIRGFLIQFHDFVPNAHQKRKELSLKLSETHVLEFEYPFVWECWMKKNL